MNPIRVMLVDASELMRLGVKAVVAAQANGTIAVVAEAATCTDAVRIAGQYQPDVMLLDLEIPREDGADTCRLLLEAVPRGRVIILTSYSTDRLVYEALTAGALGYITKTISPFELIQAIRNVADGSPIFDRDGTDRVLRLLRSEGAASGPQISRLSAQERRVLALVAAGMTNKQVGVELELSRNTVKNYLVGIFEKLNVKRRAHAAAIYVQESESGRRT
jgi:two-component system response regulator DevR